MIPPKLKAGNDWLNLSDLKNGFMPNSFNEQENIAIQFCKDWLSGNSEFEFHTSGSTGIPKKIIFKREQLETSARLTARTLKLQPGFTALICLDCKFIAGAMMIVRSLVVGMNMIVKIPSANPLNGLSDRIDFAAFVPYQFVTLLEQAPAQLNALHTIIIGGAPIPRAVIDKVQHMSPAIYATYGMTETITHVALQKLNGAGREDFFRLLPGIKASTDERGCLILKSTHLGTGPIVTNDIVTMLDGERFRWLGRFDNVINSGGVKVQAYKIERAAMDIFAILKIKKRLFVSGLPDKKLGEQVALIIEGAILQPAVEEKIKIQLKDQLDKYEVPKIFIYVLQFSETATQKIDRAGTLKMVVQEL